MSDSEEIAVPEQILKKVVPIRRTGWKHKGIVNLGNDGDNEYLRSVIKQVVVGNSEQIKISTSIMVYGPPGCGKSQVKFMNNLMCSLLLLFASVDVNSN